MGRERYSAFTVAEQQQLSAELGFLAASVVADNLTASWLSIPGAGRYVPPFTYGATFPLGAGVQVAQALWRTPPGITPPTAGAGQAQLTFTSDTLVPSNGQPVVIPSQQVPLPVASVILATNGASATVGQVVMGLGAGTNSVLQVLINVPAGANSLIICGNRIGASPGATQYSVTVQGTTTNTLYVTEVGGAAGVSVTPPVACIVSPSADPVVRVTITNQVAQTAASTFVIVASFGTQAVDVSPGGEPIAVAGANGNPVSTQVGTFGQTFLGISGVNAAQTVTLTNPNPGVTQVRLSSMVVSWSGGTTGAPSVTVFDSSGTNPLWEVIIPSSTTTNPTGPNGGSWTFPIPLATITGNGGLVITVTAAGAAGIASVVTGVYGTY